MSSALCNSTFFAVLCGVNWGVTVVGRAVVDQGHCGSCQVFAAIQAAVSQLVLTLGGLRGSLSLCSADRELHIVHWHVRLLWL